MNVVKTRRICDVRGCSNTACFSIAKSREVGNSVIICEDCLKEALKAVKKYTDAPENPVYSPAPPLFYHPELKPTAEEQPEPELSAGEVQSSEEEPTKPSETSDDAEVEKESEEAEVPAEESAKQTKSRKRK